MHCYDYPRPSVTADVVVFALRRGKLELLLIRRAHDPYQDSWALPGGFIEMEEDLEQSARRELEEETGLTDCRLQQLHTFGRPGRDPRGRVITVAYYALEDSSDLRPCAADDAAEVGWFALNKLPSLAFDHAQIITMAHKRLLEELPRSTLIFHALPEEFTLTELQSAYQAISQQPLDKRNFRKRILAQGWIEPSGGVRRGVAHRPAKLYRLKQPL